MIVIVVVVIVIVVVVVHHLYVNQVPSDVWKDLDESPCLNFAGSVTVNPTQLSLPVCEAFGRTFYIDGTPHKCPHTSEILLPAWMMQVCYDEESSTNVSMLLKSEEVVSPIKTSSDEHATVSFWWASKNNAYSAGEDVSVLLQRCAAVCEAEVNELLIAAKNVKGKGKGKGKGSSVKRGKSKEEREALKTYDTRTQKFVFVSDSSL